MGKLWNFQTVPSLFWKIVKFTNCVVLNILWPKFKQSFSKKFLITFEAVYSDKIWFHVFFLYFQPQHHPRGLLQLRLTSKLENQAIQPILQCPVQTTEASGINFRPQPGNGCPLPPWDAKNSPLHPVQADIVHRLKVVETVVVSINITMIRTIWTLATTSRGQDLTQPLTATAIGANMTLLLPIMMLFLERYMHSVEKRKKIYFKILKLSVWPNFRIIFA